MSLPPGAAADGNYPGAFDFPKMGLIHATFYPSKPGRTANIQAQADTR